MNVCQFQVAEDTLEVLLSTGGNLRIKGLTEASDGDTAEVSEEERDQLQSAWEQQVVKVRPGCRERKFTFCCQIEANKGEDQFPIVVNKSEQPDKCDRSISQVNGVCLPIIFFFSVQSSLLNVSRFLSSSSPAQSSFSPSQSGCSPPRTSSSSSRPGCSPPRAGCSPPRTGCSPPRADCSPPRITFSPVRTTGSPSLQTASWSLSRGPRKLGHQRALVQGNNENETELNRSVVLTSI